MPYLLLNIAPPIVTGKLIPLPRDGDLDDGFHLVRGMLEKLWLGIQTPSIYPVINEIRYHLLEKLIQICEDNNDIFKHIY